MKYYYLAAALPTISLKAKPDITFEELKFMLKVNLSDSDLEKAKIFKIFIDVTNLRLLWLNKEIDPRGNLNTAELEDAILIKDFFDDFVFDFLDRYEKTEDRLKYFSFLVASFFNNIKSTQKDFLKFYFKFERELRLITTALRAKKLNRDILKELQFEDFTDDFVAYILAQKDQDSFEPPHEYHKVKKIYKKHINDPKKLHLDLLKYKFNQIEIFSEKKPFSIDQILSYAALLIIVEDFYKLSEEIGREKIENL
ncbi:MAG: hypothetical protein KR126chlam4_00359 [Candidatus Anoxychlamydiales bacterium]|nr:hypothetical protein [Candidatus Anoxychlamydiales bacterium]NGX40537.1 hypothetical protein [Candidatus Anoxychlamydiales bacterium]HEU63784.1 DUF2764 family protein [Chlamydiota bacterium]